MKDETKKLLDTIKECLEKIRDLEENIYVTAAKVSNTGWVQAQIDGKRNEKDNIIWEYDEWLEEKVNE